MAQEHHFGVLCMLVIYCFGCVLSENVATGTDYTFKAGITGKFEFIDWRHKNNLVVEWEPPTKPFWYRYETRARLNTETGELSLNLTKEDSGLFESQYQQRGLVKSYKITIRVIDRVPKPQVTCQSDGENVTLVCSVNTSVPANFTWGGPNERSHVGKSLQITRNPNDADTFYYCTANNEVSKETAEFKLQLCDQPPDHKTNVGAIVGAIVGAFLFVLAVGIAAAAAAVYIKRKRGGKTSAAISNPDPNKPAQDPDSSIPLASRDSEKENL